MSSLPFQVHMVLEMATVLHPKKPLTPKRCGQDVSSLIQSSRNAIVQGNSGRLYSLSFIVISFLKGEEAGLLIYNYLSITG